MDVLGFIADAFYIGIVALWHWAYALPWPTWAELFKSLVVFCFLWKPRKWLERYWLGKPYKRNRRNFPSTTDHQAASSSIGDLFNH